MNVTPYPTEELDPEYDDGTMVENVDDLRQAVIGHRIVSTEWRKTHTSGWGSGPHEGLFITLDSGTVVQLIGTNDCCAYTALEAFLMHPDKVDHVILGVGTTEQDTRWHIYADWGDVLELTVGWSCGNPFYYGYGFDIEVTPVTP